MATHSSVLVQNTVFSICMWTEHVNWIPAIQQLQIMLENIFPSAEAKTKQTKSHHHLPTTLSANDFGRAADMKKYCLKQIRGKTLLLIECSCLPPSCSLCVFWIVYPGHLLSLQKYRLPSHPRFGTFKIIFLGRTPFRRNTLGYNTCRTQYSMPPAICQMLATRNMQGFFMLEKWWKSAHQR